MFNIVQQELKLWLYFVIQRYKIHLRKDFYKQERPWTKDELLNLYSFTNVRRIEDTVTKFTLKNICLNPALNLKQKVLNLIWFRIFNKPQTFNMFNFPIKQQDLNCSFQQVVEKYQKMINMKTLSRGAYMTSGSVKRHTQHQKQFITNMMPFYMIWQFNKTQNIERFLVSKPNQAFDILLNIRGLGQFLAYQVYIDLSYCPQTIFTQNDFVYLGDGAIKGVNYVCPKLNKLEKMQFIKYVQTNLDQWLRYFYNTSLFQLMQDLKPQDRNLTLSNIQNCFCQFSKYKSISLGKMGRVRYYGKNNGVII